MAPEYIYLIISFVFGACIGSFLNVLILRLPQEESINGRSECPHCKHELQALDLIPVLSFIFLRGKCRYCGKKISPRYWIIELITASLFLFAVWQLFPQHALDYLILFKALFVIAVCIVVFVIDFEHYLILDKIIFPACAALLIVNIALDFVGHTGSVHFLSGVYGALIAGIPFWALCYFSGQKLMGYGDAKYMVFMGLALGFPNVLLGLFLSFILGSLVGIPLLISGRKQMSSKLPFGTFLAVCTVIALFWGPSIINWYIKLISY
jgi:leader peptidase (prepilin peptidase)/N-methyltransferase